MENLIAKLEKEEFAGKCPEWSEGRCGDLRVLWARDNDGNSYFRYRSNIYVLASGSNTPHCYGCGTKIEFKKQNSSLWVFGCYSHYVGSEIRHIPYCPKCEKEPEDKGDVFEGSFHKPLFCR